jgi:hypothetical protein
MDNIKITPVTIVIVSLFFALGMVIRLWVAPTYAVGEQGVRHRILATQGHTYYVAPDGNDSNDGSIDHPWATVQHAGRTAGPGDTILVRGGTYNEGEIWLRADYGHCGADGQMLTIRAYPGETPVFVNGNRPFIVECDYLRVEGLHFQNGKSIVIRGLDRTTIQIVNNTFTGSGYSWDAISAEGNNILLEGNVCDIEGNTVGTQGHCYYVHHGTNIILRHNVARGMTGYGIHIFDQRRSNDPPGFERLIKDVVVEGNVCYDSQQRAGIILAAYDHARIENVIIRNNIVFNNAIGGIVLRSESKDIYVYNNTLYGNGGDAIVIGGSGSLDNLVIVNNILDTTGSGNVYHVNNTVNEPTVSLDNNLYWPAPVRLNNISDSHPITGDPQFVDPASHDFHLRSTSPAIDAGVSIPQVMDDFDGTPRPQGAAYDVGAYETMPCYDFDASGRVDAGDLDRMRAHWRQRAGDPNWDARFDLDGDSCVSVVDLMQVASQVGKRCQ